MKTFIIFCLTVCLILTIGCRNNSKSLLTPEKIIFDSDFGPDYDDVGAISILHAMADSGKAEILATISCNSNALVGPSLEIFNRYFQRPEIPIGAPSSGAVNMGPFQHWSDSLVTKYPHKNDSTAQYENAVKLYRKILASQPDTSVTVVTVGFLTNLANLLKSEADSLSPLTGKELVTKKVKQLVCMAGSFPSGREFNVFMDSTSSSYTFEYWPTKIIFTGFEIGSKLFTGKKLIESSIQHSPVKDVFRISIPMAKEDSNGRMSWDETAVMIGVYGTSPFFETVKGRIIIHSDGSNSWENEPYGKHTYVRFKSSPESIAKFLEDRMMHEPFKK